MPIEINEVIVRAVINEPQRPAAQNNYPAETDEKIQRIIDQVLTQVRKKNER